MNTNKYEFDSTEEMLKLSDFHFDQNVDPVQGPEDQAREAQGPEDQAWEAQGPEDQAREAQGPEDQAREAQGPENQAREAQGPENQAPEDQAPEDQAPEAQGLEVQAQNETMQTQRATYLQALWKKNIDRLTRDNIELRSNMEVIEQQNRMLDSCNEDLRRVVKRRKIKTNQVVPNSGPPGMMMPFGVPHNNFAPNPHQQAAQAHARMQQQQQPRLVPPSRTNVASGEGADAAGSDAGGGDDAPGQGP